MRKTIVIIFLLLVTTVSAKANTLILNDAIDTYRVISSETITFSKDKNEIWGAYTTNETLSLLHSSNQDLSFKEIKTNINIGKIEDFIYQNNTLHLIHNKDQKHYYRQSINNATSFNPAIELFDQETKDLSIKTSNNLIFIAFLSNDRKSIFCYKSINHGQTFSKEEIKLPGFAQVKEIEIDIDDEQRIHLYIISNDNNSNKIDHYKKQENIWQNQTIYLTNNSIDNLRLFSIRETKSLAITFFEQGLPQLILAGANRKNVGFPKEIKTNFEKYLGLFYYSKKLYWVSDKAINEITTPLPDAIKVLYPTNNTRINQNIIKVNLSDELLNYGNLFYRIDMSQDSNFDPASSFSLYLSSKEAEIIIPFESSEFYLRTQSSNGINWSNYSKPIKTIIDKVGPTIKQIKYPDVINSKEFNVIIEFSEPVTFESGTIFTLNNQNIIANEITIKDSSLEAILETPSINKGEYSLNINNIYDYSKNPLISSTEYKTSINPDAPSINIIKPNDNEWYKPDATIILEASVSYMNKNISQNPNVTLAIDNQKQNHQINYYPNLNKMFGFIKMPQDITNGKHEIMLELKDNNENTGKEKILFNIDSLSPKVIAPESPSSKRDNIKFKFIETGSGIDLDSSIIKILAASIEVEGTSEVIADCFYFYPKEELKDGKYEIQTALRDNVGNIDLEQVFYLVIKEGIVNQETIGQNSIATSFRFGPNPFYPERENLKILYNLNSPSEVNLFIFTINGQNIYRTTSGSASSHTITWNGKDQFGLYVPNGVYLFALTHGESIQRGKIIVLR